MTAMFRLNANEIKQRIVDATNDVNVVHGQKVNKWNATLYRWKDGKTMLTSVTVA